MITQIRQFVNQNVWTSFVVLATLPTDLLMWSRFGSTRNRPKGDIPNGFRVILWNVSWLANPRFLDMYSVGQSCPVKDSMTNGHMPLTTWLLRLSPLRQVVIVFECLSCLKRTNTVGQIYRINTSEDRIPIQL